MKFLTILFFISSLVVVFSSYVSPVTFWPAGFIVLFIPIVLILNFLLLILLLLKKRSLAVFPTIVLIAGFKFILSSYSFHFNSDDSAADFSILSYNTSKLLKKDIYSNDFQPEADEMMAWLAEQDADIKCFQEFYNNNDSKHWNSIEKLKMNGEYYNYFSGENVTHTTGEIGVATFSKYPIINKGDLLFSKNYYNRGSFVDVVIKGDTIRVVNVHLQSMQIKGAKPSENSSVDQVITNLRFMYYRIKHGAMERCEQSKVLLDFIQESPYKVVVCGDFNETPYSYVYNSFKEKLDNSFEKAGDGFGFTYNGNTLFFLRIDNQFYGEGLEATRLKTHNEVRFSDHFPVFGTYVFNTK